MSEAKVWSFSDVEERMIEATEFLAKVTPGMPRLRATDGPWSLVIVDSDAGRQTADAMADYATLETLGEMMMRWASERDGLRSEEVDRMHEASEWILLVPIDERRLRAIVGAVLEWKVRESRVDWAWVKRRARSRADHDAIRMAYRRAMLGIRNALNARASLVTV